MTVSVYQNQNLAWGYCGVKHKTEFKVDLEHKSSPQQNIIYSKMCITQKVKASTYVVIALEIRK